MINLLAYETQIKIRRLYRGRVVVVSLAVSFLLIVVSAVLLLPSYFIFSVKDRLTKELLKDTQVSVSEKGVEDNLKLIADAGKKIAVLKLEESNISVKTFIDKLISYLQSGIALGSISYQNEYFLVRGTADSRRDLLDFVRSLEKDPMFASVDSPISNLIADKDINFSLKVALPQRPVSK